MCRRSIRDGANALPEIRRPARQKPGFGQAEPAFQLWMSTARSSQRSRTRPWLEPVTTMAS